MIKALNIYDFSKFELEEFLTSKSYPKYRTSQIWRYLYRNNIDNFEDMKNIPTDLISDLNKYFFVEKLNEVNYVISKDKSTYKSLFELSDNLRIETVLMNYPSDDHRKPRKTICVSSQVGCALGCTFCATGQQGFFRQLKAGEIISQIMYFKKLEEKKYFDSYLSKPEKSYDGIKNIVFMGMGEPLANFNNTIKAIKILNDPNGINLGARSITISTVGLVPEIIKLSKENIQINLAVSLHAPDNFTREQTVPINKRYPIEMLIDACKKYIQQTNRKIFFEYVLLSGQNDSTKHANDLGVLLKGMLAHVNLIPVNPTKLSEYKRTSDSMIIKFQNELKKSGIPSTVRMEKGIEVSAGCGQLATSNKY